MKKQRAQEHHTEIYNFTDNFLPVMMFRTWEKKRSDYRYFMKLRVSK